MNRIIIIGGGLSGRLVTFNLLRQASQGLSVSVRIIDRGGVNYMGPAYSTDSFDLLLNVPVGLMGALPEEPEHFCKWVRNQGDRAEPGDFLPRRLYHDYVLSLMSEAVRARASEFDFEHIQGEVTDIELDGQLATVHLKGCQPLTADRVVLALGNFLPRHPPVVHSSALESRRYARNPWDTHVLDGLSDHDPVVFIGTGQTMVDLALLLHKNGHEGPLTALSRRGLLPLAHRRHESYPSFFGEIRGSTSLLHVFRTVRQHLDRAARMGLEQQAVIDSLRPDTQELWAGFPEAEKCRFLRHVFRYWERIRSRIPPQSEEVIDKLHAAGQLRIVAGRVRDLVDTGKAIEVHYTPRRRTTHEVVTAALVINCIGPELNYEMIDHPLVQNLLRRGLICPGPAQLGISTRASGAVVSQAGDTSNVLFTIGSPMKGLFWEMVAVPEIRVQAKKLARLLLNPNAPQAEDE
jgi:uncharacterized NAD(P)/FAD-binding protein YdhS